MTNVRVGKTLPRRQSVGLSLVPLWVSTLPAPKVDRSKLPRTALKTKVLRMINLRRAHDAMKSAVSLERRAPSPRSAVVTSRFSVEYCNKTHCDSTRPYLVNDAMPCNGPCDAVQCCGESCPPRCLCVDTLMMADCVVAYVASGRYYP